MFRVTFFCDDKRVGDCLRALAGLAQGTPEVVPVVNAVKGANGELKPKIRDGNVHDLFVDWIKQHRKTEVVSTDVKEFLREVGASPLSHSYVLTVARERGVVRKTGSKSGAGTQGVIWKVVPPKKSRKRDFAKEYAKRQAAAAAGK